MSEVSFPGVRIRGVAAAVPDQVRTLADDAKVFGEDEVRKVSESAGVKQRHISSILCASDLCFAAAERLLAESDCPAEDVDALVFISQTSDYILPATSCCLQERLGLSKDCATFDVNLGCSGHVYGLWVVSSLIASGAARRALVLSGDTIHRMCSPEDRSVALLFGDAGTATLLERCEDTVPSHFVLGTDGSGQDHLKVGAGGCRTPWTPAALQRVECEGGNKRGAGDLYMNGAEVFSFTLRAVPPLVKKVLGGAGKVIGDVDGFVFHQANKFMLEHLGKRLKVPKDKLILSLENFGNTSSASIPLAMVTELGDRLRSEELDLVLAGFGVGFSWAAASLRCGDMTVPELVLVPVP
ncbi:MAG: ketoacyl-ACP synthase III [Sedimenticola sp.]|nr:MAG: ketoacyl-ACP synthase III [Sedimenticola sp.]